MNSCEQIQEQFVEALYDDLNADSKKEFEAHLKSCPNCRAEFSSMRSTLQVMDERKHTDPGDEFWGTFDRKLQQRVSNQQVIAFRKKAPAWVWQVAAAIVLIGIGIVIGRFNMKNTEPEKIVKRPIERPAQVQMASADLETQRFLERSEVLLLGVVNTDANEAASYESHLTHQKQVSRDLIQQASLIKNKLNDDPRKRRLRELVSDLQVILLQIANLEAEKDQPEIEILKSGVDRKGLLLKINLEQMRLSSPEASKPEPSQTQKGPAI